MKFDKRHRLDLLPFFFKKIFKLQLTLYAVKAQSNDAKQEFYEHNCKGNINASDFGLFFPPHIFIQIVYLIGFLLRYRV